MFDIVVREKAETNLQLLYFHKHSESFIKTWEEADVVLTKSKKKKSWNFILIGISEI